MAMIDSKAHTPVNELQKDGLIIYLIT
jgi:hypothetical protein